MRCISSVPKTFHFRIIINESATYERCDEKMTEESQATQATR